MAASPCRAEPPPPRYTKCFQFPGSEHMLRSGFRLQFEIRFQTVAVYDGVKPYIGVHWLRTHKQRHFYKKQRQKRRKIILTLYWLFYMQYSL